jgi:deoxyribonuclease V
MKLAVKVERVRDCAVAAALAFEDWDAPEASKTYTSRMAQVDKPARGTLDLRELHCVLQLLREHALAPDVIVIDGFVHLDAQETPGWGRHLHQALGGGVAIIGVSKKAMPDGPTQFQVSREEEAPPLVVTCIGIDIGAAKARLRTMHGKRRMPTLLKLVARIAKGAAV